MNDEVDTLELRARLPLGRDKDDMDTVAMIHKALDELDALRGEG